MSATPLFQMLEENTFEVIQLQYGQDCIWASPEGLLTDLVLFNDPTAERRVMMDAGRGLAHRGYDNSDITDPYIEFMKGKLTGLYDAVYDDTSPQYVLVNGAMYICVHDTSKYDGQTYRIALQRSSYQLYIASISIGTT